MRRFERQVFDLELIDEMLKVCFNQVTLSMHDTDSFPYSVPMTYGYEFTETQLIVYVHCAKKGHKVDLINRDPHVCLCFSAYNDFPDREWKKHRHDYRSIIAKGTITLLDYQDDPELYERGYNSLYTCNNRDIVPLSSRPAVPPMYIGVIRCDLKQVTAKSEFPLRTKKDVPFINVYDMPDDDTPFDLKDIIEKNRLLTNQKD